MPSSTRSPSGPGASRRRSPTRSSSTWAAPSVDRIRTDRPSRTGGGALQWTTKPAGRGPPPRRARAGASACMAWTGELWEAVRPYSTGRVYVNFLGEEGPDRVRAAYGEAKYERLRTLKSKYDPTNFFRLNQNIRPERGI